MYERGFRSFIAYLVECLELVSLLDAGEQATASFRSLGRHCIRDQDAPGVSADWRNVDHSISELDEGTSAAVISVHAHTQTYVAYR